MGVDPNLADRGGLPGISPMEQLLMEQLLMEKVLVKLANWPTDKAFCLTFLPIFNNLVQKPTEIKFVKLCPIWHYI